MNSMEVEELWKGVCFDDGTGRNVFYIDVNGQVRDSTSFTPARSW